MHCDFYKSIDHINVIDGEYGYKVNKSIIRIVVDKDGKKIKQVLHKTKGWRKLNGIQ